MSKMRLLTIIVIGILATILAVSFSVNQAKADHCHPSHTEASPDSTTAPMQSNRSVSSTVSSKRPQRNKTRVLNINKKSAQTNVPSLIEINSKIFPEAIASISEAVKAIQSGDRQAELVELSKALQKLITIQKALKTHTEPQYANSLSCPIMGSPIYIKTADMNLIRDYEGRKIVFCCRGCPAQWDKLTKVQKQAKLTGVKL